MICISDLVLIFGVTDLRKVLHLWILNSISIRWVYIAVSSYLDSAFKGVLPYALLVYEYFIIACFILAVNSTHLYLTFIVIERIQVEVCIVAPFSPPGCWDQVALVILFVVYKKTLESFYLRVERRLFIFTFLIYYLLLYCL